MATSAGYEIMRWVDRAGRSHTSHDMWVLTCPTLSSKVCGVAPLGVRSRSSRTGMPSLGALIALQSGSQMAILVIRPFHPSTQWAIRPPADEVNTERDDSSEHRNFWGQGEYQRPQTDDERDVTPAVGVWSIVNRVAGPYCWGSLRSVRLLGLTVRPCRIPGGRLV